MTVELSFSSVRQIQPVNGSEIRDLGPTRLEIRGHWRRELDDSFPMACRELQPGEVLILGMLANPTLDEQIADQVLMSLAEDPRDGYVFAVPALELEQN